MACEDRLTELAAERDPLQTRVTGLESEVHTVWANVADLKQQLATAEAVYTELRQTLTAANDRLAVALSSCVDILYKLKYAGGITLSPMGMDALDEANACLRMWSNSKDSKPTPAENGETK